jgi:PAS domain S-box-containing protein
MKKQADKASRNTCSVWRYPFSMEQMLQSAPPSELLQAEGILEALANIFFPTAIAPDPTCDLAIDDKASDSDLNTEWPDAAARYRIHLEQIPAVVFMAFFDKGIGEAYISPQIEAILGFTQEEWLDDPVRWYQQIHPDDKVRWSVEAAQMLSTGDPLRSVYRLLARDGRIVWFHCEAQMVRRADGRPWFIHGVGFDITDLKQAEETSNQSERMLRGIFEHAPDAIVLVDSEGHIERVNEQVERMFGHRRYDLIGQPVEVLLPERFCQRHVQYRTSYLDDPHLRPMGVGGELYGKRKDGSEFPVDITLSPVETQTGSLVIAVIRDITRHKQVDEALRENAERLQVLSRRLIEVQEAERRYVALELHDEIGQILTGLKLTLEMGARLPADEAQQSIAQAQTMVNQLLARTRKLSIDLRPTTLDHLGLLSALWWHIKHYTSQTQVQVTFKHSGLEGKRFAPELETAAFRIVQEALTNVVRHAKVSDITVRAWADLHGLTLQIEDPGQGFHPEEVLETSHTSGLAGMRERAALSGGQLTIESRPERGTKLTAEWRLSDPLTC